MLYLATTKASSCIMIPILKEVLSVENNVGMIEAHLSFLTKPQIVKIVFGEHLKTQSTPSVNKLYHI